MRISDWSSDVCSSDLFLELVSWLAHDHHSDAPRSVSPVLATYARWFASALDDRRRQELKGRAVRFVGTADGAPPRGPGRTTRLTITDLDRKSTRLNSSH